MAGGDGVRRRVVKRWGQKGNRARSCRTLKVTAGMLVLSLGEMVNCQEILIRGVSSNWHFNRITLVATLRIDLRGPAQKQEHQLEALLQSPMQDTLVTWARVAEC